MNCDLLMQHSIYCDYPVWRMNLKRYRGTFNQVILYPSDHNRELSFEPFLKRQIDETWVTGHEVNWSEPGVDWRQAETEPMLPLVRSEWIYFTEPDWFVKDYEKFYAAVKEAMKTADAIGWMNPTAFPYLHPSCFFIKKSILEKTQKDFRAHPEIPGCDHFAMITRDLEKMGAKIVTTEDMGFEYWKDCFHLGGLTQNYIDTVVNPELTFHRPDIFHVYNSFARKADVPQSPEFLELSLKVEEILKQRHPEAVTNPETSSWSEFFK